MFQGQTHQARPEDRPLRPAHRLAREPERGIQTEEPNRADDSRRLVIADVARRQEEQRDFDRDTAAEADARAVGLRAAKALSR